MKHNITIEYERHIGFGGYEGHNSFTIQLTDNASGKSGRFLVSTESRKTIEDLFVNIIEFTESLYEPVLIEEKSAKV